LTRPSELWLMGFVCNAISGQLVDQALRIVANGICV